MFVLHSKALPLMAAWRASRVANPAIAAAGTAFRPSGKVSAVAGAQRHFSTAAAAAESAVTNFGSPKYPVVPFEREDLVDVMKEVPEVKYFYFPFDPQDNPYAKIPMTQPVDLNELSSEDDPVRIDFDRRNLLRRHFKRLQLLDPKNHSQSFEEQAFINRRIPVEVDKIDVKTRKLTQGELDEVSVETPLPPFSADGKLRISQLENGLRIASIDRGEATTSLGLFVHAGSRHETPANFGAAHMVEALAFHSTAHLSWLRTVKTIETIGASAGCHAGREHTVYHAECLRQYVPIMVPLLVGNVLFPRFLPWEVKDNEKKVVDARQRLEKSADAHITELLHTTAWQNNTLGNKLFVTEKGMANFTPEVIRQFMLDNFSPDRMVFMGVNVDHDVLCKWLMRAFVDYNAIPSTPRSEESPVYTGGECRVETDSPSANLAIAFECEGGWNSPDLVALTVLQTILGGGGSFSTGGPGKGLYTRLYTGVLSSDWVESCMAFNTQYTDSGIFGLYMTALPHHGPEMARLLVEQLLRMGQTDEEELSRAKNALKASIWMNLESRAVVLEDVARQLLMSDLVRSGSDFCESVDRVTAEDIQRVASKMLTTKKPTVIAYGDIAGIPNAAEIEQLLRQE